jgi:hypothetical protein
LDRRPSVGASLDGFQDPVSCVQMRNSIFEGEIYPKTKPKKTKNRGSESIATDKTASFQGVCLMEIFVTEF